MKILHINNRFDWSGGSQTYLIQLIEELRRRGVDNVVVYGEESSVKEENIKSYYIPQISNFSFFREKKRIRQLYKIISHEKPDIIYLHNVDNIPLIQFCSKILPTFIFMHDYRFICPGNTKYYIKQEMVCEKNFGFQCLVYPYLKKCSNRRPDRVLKSFYRVLKAKSILTNVQIIVASDYVKKRFIQEGFNESNITVIPYFTDLPKFVNANYNHKKILYLGRVAEAKGVNHLLRALALVKSDYETIITGSGRNLDNLKNLTIYLHIDNKVKFIGWVDKEQREELLENCAFVVIPSLWPECFGIVGIEAMAFEKPVISYNVGGITSWLKDERNGFLVPRANYKKLAEKIDFLLNNPDISIKFGMKGRVMVQEKFSAEKHIEKLLRIFKERI